MREEHSLVLRPATAADITAILELELQALTAAHWSEKQYATMLANSGQASVRFAIVAEEPSDVHAGSKMESQSTVRAFLVARNAGSEWELENLVVAEACRRRGLGRRLIAELIRQAQQSKAHSVFLEVRDSNQAARRLYEGMGFAIRGRRKGYYSAPDEDALIYRLDLQ
ncbi:MAG TPA: ribosomal protein S18-alanine N-acetyltransferase [Candidatus Aquilonibacter sp.]|nr:ribosomal protein S18-alanine N-acetyltransferase [Candidatus Aquilonibacter sp.]